MSLWLLSREVSACLIIVNMCALRVFRVNGLQVCVVLLTKLVRAEGL